MKQHSTIGGAYPRVWLVLAWRRAGGLVLLAAAVSLGAESLQPLPRDRVETLAPPWLAVAAASGEAKGANVHTSNGPCLTCHTADKSVLDGDRARARTLLRADLELVCNRCHGDQGASHQTGIAAKGKVPASLPLTADGKIACATCHYMHGENNTYGDFVRIDNRRGGLCLSCHQLSDLQ